MTLKFKVGDVVRVNVPRDRHHMFSGVVRKVSETGLPYAVEFDTGWSYFEEYELDLVHAAVESVTPTLNTTLPSSSEGRKQFPLYSGPLKYFPAALAAVAKVCKIGNDKHQPGKPLQHARGKSGDHADCILRHLIDMSEDYGKGEGRDENGVPQVAYIAWRALALAQEWYEKYDNKPIAPGATFEDKQ